VKANAKPNNNTTEFSNNIDFNNILKTNLNNNGFGTENANNFNMIPDGMNLNCADNNFNNAVPKGSHMNTGGISYNNQICRANNPDYNNINNYNNNFQNNNITVNSNPNNIETLQIIQIITVTPLIM
jgi:hypothetical protein